MREAYHILADVGGFIAFWSVMFVLGFVIGVVRADHRKSKSIKKSFRNIEDYLKAQRNESQ